MSLAAELGYGLTPRAGLRRAVASLFSTRLGAWLGYHVVPPVDRLARRVTGGRGTVTGWFAGLDPLWLTSVGARSGQQRSTPLFGIPVGDDVALIGTGFGQNPTPAWVYNLEADPQASVTYEGKSVRVKARPATPDEESEAWVAGRDIYPGFAAYQRRVTNREIRVFVLDPV